MTDYNTQAPQLTDEEKVEILKAQIRVERNKRLQECDWTQLVDNGLSTDKKAEWIAYRQQLRDLPNTIQIEPSWNYVTMYNNTPWATKP